MDDKVAEFVGITGAGADQAKQFLEITGNNLEEAVLLFFTSQESNDSESLLSRIPETQPQRPNPRIRNHQHQNQNPNQSDVRAPINSVVDNLYASIHSNRTEAMMDVDEADEVLFPIPPDMSFRGTFEQAKEFALVQRRYILLNIQDYSEFACHSIDRDIWNSPTIQEFLKTFFVFLQVKRKSGDGELLLGYYPILGESSPAVGLIDPRTGELIKQLPAQVPLETMLDMLATFTESKTPVQAPFRPDPEPNLRQIQWGANAFVSTNDEDEELRRAIEASLQETEQNRTDASSNAVSQPNANSTVANVGGEIEVESPVEREVVASRPEPIPEPDPSEPNLSRIVFRMPSGERIERRFSNTTTVAQLIDFVWHASSEKCRFRLTTPMPKQVLDESQNLEEAKLGSRAMIVVEKVD